MCAARDRKPGFDSEYTGIDLRIKLRGEIDHHSAAAIRGAIDDMIRAKRPGQLIIDMSAVDFMDSSGLGLIMGRYAVMKELGGSITVSDPNPATEKIMNLAGMERIIRIKHTSPRAGMAQGRVGAAMSVATTDGAKAVSGASKRRSPRKDSGREGKKK